MGKRRPEKLIANLRRRKSRIVGLVVVVIVAAVLTVMYVYFTIQFWSKLSPDAEHTLATVYCGVKGLFFALLLGVMVAKLIGVLTSYTREELLVEMWDRLKSLEERLDKT